jgi:hypothetical protein
VQVQSSLSQDMIANPEELASWARIKSSQSSQDFRDHLARFARGPTAHRAQTRLQKLAWSALGPTPDISAVKSFLGEFSKGACVGNAKRRLTWFENQDWTDACNADTAAAYNSFISAWPKSRHVRSALRGPDLVEKGTKASAVAIWSTEQRPPIWPSTTWPSVINSLFGAIVILIACVGFFIAFCLLVLRWQDLYWSFRGDAPPPVTSEHNAP